MHKGFERLQRNFRSCNPFVTRNLLHHFRGVFLFLKKCFGYDVSNTLLCVQGGMGMKKANRKKSDSPYISFKSFDRFRLRFLINLIVSA